MLQDFFLRTTFINNFFFFFCYSSTTVYFFLSDIFTAMASFIKYNTRNKVMIYYFTAIFCFQFITLEHQIYCRENCKISLQGPYFAQIICANVPKKNILSS